MAVVGQGVVYIDENAGEHDALIVKLNANGTVKLGFIDAVNGVILKDNIPPQALTISCYRE